MHEQVLKEIKLKWMRYFHNVLPMLPLPFFLIETRFAKSVLIQPFSLGKHLFNIFKEIFNRSNVIRHCALESSSFKYFPQIIIIRLHI